MNRKTGFEKGTLFEAVTLFDGDDGGAFRGVLDNFYKAEWNHGRTDNPCHEATMLVIGCFNEEGQLPGDLVAIPLLCPHCGEPFVIPDQVQKQIDFALQKARNQKLCWYGSASTIADLIDLPPYDLDYDKPSQLGLAITDEGIFVDGKTVYKFPPCKEKKLVGETITLSIVLDREADEKRLDMEDARNRGLILTHPASLFYVQFASIWKVASVEEVGPEPACGQDPVVLYTNHYRGP